MSITISVNSWELDLCINLKCIGLGGFFDFEAMGGELWIGPFGVVLTKEYDQ